MGRNSAGSQMKITPQPIIGFPPFFYLFCYDIICSIKGMDWGAITNYIGNIDWATPTWDLFIVLFFIVGALLYGLSLGRDRIIVILVSIYMGLAVVSNAPYIQNFNAELTINQNFVIKIGMFLGVFVLLFFLLSRSALLKTLGSNAGGSWWQVIAFSFLQCGLMISVTLSFLPAGATENLSDFVQQSFLSDPARFCWLVLPIVLMAFVKGKKKEEE